MHVVSESRFNKAIRMLIDEIARLNNRIDKMQGHDEIILSGKSRQQDFVDDLTEKFGEIILDSD